MNEEFKEQEDMNKPNETKGQALEPEENEMETVSPAEETPFRNRIDLSGIQEAVDDIKREIGKVIVGQEELVELMTIALLSEGHVLIEGVPGIAKTLSAKLMAQTINAGFSRIQFTPDLMPSDVLGTSVFNFQNSSFEFKAGPIFSNLILIDEVNRAPAKTQAALFEVMEEKQVTIDGKTHRMKNPFFVLATQNPIEQEGTYRLPEAQLDRFLFKIDITYPTYQEEVSILKHFNDPEHKAHDIKINAVFSKDKIDDFKKKIRQVYVEEHLLEYIATIIQRTREHRDLFLGASPRASLAIMHTAKTHAAINGRDFVTPDDIKRVAPHVLAHRIILTPEKEMEGASPKVMVEQILQNVEVPR